MTSIIRLKRSVRTIPTLEEQVQKLLRTTDNPDTIRNICRLFPFQDETIPLTVLSERWDSRLDSFLISENIGAEQEILQLSGKQKATKLLRLLDPLQEKHGSMWTWAPPQLSETPHDIARTIHKVISNTFFQITLREWLLYLDGNEVMAVQRLLLAFRCISIYIKQLPLEKYEKFEKVFHSGDPLGCCVFGHDSPEQILYSFFLSPMENVLKCRSASVAVEKLAVLNQRYIAMAKYTGRNWHNLWMDLEDSKTLGRSTIAQSQQGVRLLGNRWLVLFWVVLCNAATMVVVKLFSTCQTWTIRGSRNPVLDIEKGQQNHGASSWQH